MNKLINTQLSILFINRNVSSIIIKLIDNEINDIIPIITFYVEIDEIVNCTKSISCVINRRMIDTSCQVVDVRLMVKPEIGVWLQLSGSGMQWTWWTNTSFGGTPQLSSVTYRASSPNSSRLTLGSKTRPLIYILAPITVHTRRNISYHLHSAWISRESSISMTFAIHQIDVLSGNLLQK